MTRQARYSLFCLMLLFICSPATAFAAGENLFASKNRAEEFNGLIITLVGTLINRITLPSDMKDKHQVGGSARHDYLDDGSDLVSFNNYRIRVGPAEEYTLNGTFLIPVSETFDIVNKTGATLNFIVDGKDWPIEISQFKYSLRDVYENEMDFQLISYEISFSNRVTGEVVVKTVEPVKLNYADTPSQFTGAKPVSGKLAIRQISNAATVTILPTPENYTWSIMSVETGNKTYQSEWRYLHPHALRTFPVKY